jgi:hypothetical protein
MVELIVNSKFETDIFGKKRVLARLMGIMADLLANLPPVPPSLKSIAPYLQRAEELRTQDPVIAYWCKYKLS